MIATIFFGLAGLGLVIFVHELGHFLAARAVGVEVEIFSLGWGPKLIGFTRGSTEYRISVFPIGGYCKMKGDDSFRKALEEKAETLPSDPGSFYGASPGRRIAISIAGPAANVLLAAVIYFAVAAVGYTVPVASNRIVLASHYDLDGKGAPKALPADAAGLRSGDRIVSADGKPITDYSELQETVALSADRAMNLGVEREGKGLSLRVVPALDRDSGAGRIGVYSWIDPVVGEILPGSAAALAGMEPGDIVVSADAKPVRQSIDLLAALALRPERVVLGLERRGMPLTAALILSWASDGQSNLGLSWRMEKKTIRSSTIGEAFGTGLNETWKTFSISVRSLGLLFKGVDLLKAISGPVRITYLVGRAASEGLSRESVGGLAVTMNFLAFLSIGLFIMNLLPIPALDGGQIILFVVEILRRKQARVLTIYRFQFAGAMLVLAIFVLATVGDVLFFTAK
jgi:regulator of sigma E protease